MKNKLIYLVDIDGTIANLSHRLHFIQQEKPDWNGFFAACVNDGSIQEVIDTINALYDAGALVVLVTGRSDAVRCETIEWLDSRLNGWADLYMRKAGDHRPDDIVKSELLDQILELYKPITAAFEDRQQVVDMYRKRGLRVFQVAEGNF